MLNLVALYERARYPATFDGDGDVSGLEAYRRYGSHSLPIFSRVGGRQVWIGRPELMLIGPADEKWDIAFIAEYPSVDAFVEMVKDADYQRIVVHRQAAVKTSRLLRLEPGIPGSGFGAEEG